MKTSYRQQFLERSRDPETVKELPPPINTFANQHE